MNPTDIKAIAAKSITEVRAAAEALSRVKGFNMAGLKGLREVTPVVVEHVEAIGKQEGLCGADKKALAIEIILQLVHLPAWFPEMFARWILSSGIDAACNLINRR